MPSANLCTRDNVKTFLGLGGTTHDAAIDLLLPNASEAIELYCRRRFAQTAYAECYDGAGDTVVLRRRPVINVTHVWDDPYGEFHDESLLDPSEYFVEAARGFVTLRAGRFFAGRGNVKVVYDAGYTLVPSDVAQACILLVAHWFGRGREAVEPMPEAVTNLLTPHREPVV